MKIPRKWGLEGWYTAHLFQLVFIQILVATFIYEHPGSATQVGLAMGIWGLSGLLASFSKDIALSEINFCVCHVLAMYKQTFCLV
ncbi:hypothetical protein [Agarivorans sp. Toyoura001]|uniref:hypothetical protein n=1 Tax=unclassified Agarivorans TaxID=2636026 RepID=UPI0010EFCAB2|nr:hypothetical protein [Agarivorans sp. Toyoura001]GDY25825.1 hypothetical protein AHAT_17150 [Agarivorans sp. Toyoura001]